MPSVHAFSCLSKALHLEHFACLGRSRLSTPPISLSLSSSLSLPLPHPLPLPPSPSLSLPLRPPPSPLPLPPLPLPLDWKYPWGTRSGAGSPGLLSWTGSDVSEVIHGRPLRRRRLSQRLQPSLRLVGGKLWAQRPGGDALDRSITLGGSVRWRCASMPT